MIGPTETLDEKEEFALADEIQKHGREADVIRLVMANLQHAVAYTTNFCKRRLSEQELISLCYETMMKNARRFKSGGLRFFAFTKIGLRGAVYRHWTSESVVRNATEISSLSLMEEYTIEHDNFLFESGDDNAEHHPPPWEATFNQIVQPDFDAINTRERLEAIKPVMDKVLTTHEKMIIDLSYIQGLNNCQIGDLLDVSRERIRQIKEESLRKVRCELLEKGRLLNGDQ